MGNKYSWTQGCYTDDVNKIRKLLVYLTYSLPFDLVSIYACSTISREFYIQHEVRYQIYEMSDNWLNANVKDLYSKYDNVSYIFWI